LLSHSIPWLRHSIRQDPPGSDSELIPAGLNRDSFGDTKHLARASQRHVGEETGDEVRSETPVLASLAC